MATRETPQIEVPRPEAIGLTPALFRGFFDATREAMLVLDERLHIVECNPAAERLFAVGSGPATGRSFLDGVDQVDRAAVELLLLDVFHLSRGTHEIRAECRRGDGLPFPADISVAPFFLSGRTMLAVVVHDRTLVERTQQRLRSEQELFRTLFANAPVPIREEDFSGVGDWFVELRAKGVADLEAYIDTHEDEFIDAIMKIRTVRVNPAFVRLMQAEEEKELLAGFQSAEFSRGTLDSFRRQFVAFWDGGDYHEAEFVGYDRKGEPFECFVTVSVQRTETGLDLSRVIAAFLDLTEIRSNQRSLERLISDKDQFIASVSHELRTPLASVLGLSDELHHHWDRFSTDEIRQLIGIIFDQSGDLASLVEDLLVAAKTEMGSLSIHPERVDVAGLVDESITELVASGTLSAPISVTGRARAAHADPVRVRQIIRNLVTNAVRYGGDHVWIEMGRDDLPYLRVIDDGDGIPVEERDRIFDPYHRATGPDAKLGALGLGLTISRQLARMMDGDLSYDYQDGESIFTLTLPGAR